MIASDREREMVAAGKMRRCYEKEVPEAGKDGSYTILPTSGPTSGQTGLCSVDSIEWWYFDAVLDNGATIVVIFSTKPPDDPVGALSPEVRITIRPPGRDAISSEQIVHVPAADMTTSEVTCDVSLGKKNRIWDVNRDMKTFLVRAEAGNLEVRLILRSETPPVRIGDGYLGFDLADQPSHYFGWFVPVPHGKVEARYRIDGEWYETEGFGYHDHNWADVPLVALANNWYWGHARIGRYTIIASLVTPQGMYGERALPELVLIDGEEVIISGPKNSGEIVFSTERPVNDSRVGSPFAGVLRYECSHENLKYVVTFRQPDMIFTEPLGPTSRYRRFLGTCTLEITEDQQTSMRALSEFLWLGSLPAVAAA